MQSSNTSMHGKICMVTGATAGIGEVTAQALARMGADVILVGRSQQKCADTVTRIKEKTGNSSVECLLADLSSQAQIRELVAQFHNRYDRLDVLVNNAGGAFIWRQESVDGIEMTFALNHLNYFLLTNLLLDTIKNSSPARIVNVSSNSHYGANINFEGKNNGWYTRLVLWFLRLWALTPQEGARTNVYLASSPEVSDITGKYFFKEKQVKSDPASYDAETARRLWEVSAEMVGI